jgi:HEAT repeat protein
MVLNHNGKLGRTLNVDGKKQLVENLRHDTRPESVSALSEMLKDESWYLRELASNALVERGRIAVPALLAVLVDGLWYSRACAAVALGRLGAAEAAPAVSRMLAEPNRTVTQAAVHALVLLAAAGASAAVAHALDRAGHDARHAFLAHARARDAAVAERVASLLEENVADRGHGAFVLNPLAT